MKFQNFKDNKQKPLLVLAPLDWGLGHTTRCIPIIRYLLDNEIDVIIACNSIQKALLAAEFPQVRFVYLEGYSVQYGNSGFFTFLKLIRQIPRIIARIKKEKAWLDDFLKHNKVDCIISDNRYGLYSDVIPSIFITHQLAPVSAAGLWADNFIRKKLYKYINRFRECWVPDIKEIPGMAGTLSHPDLMPAIPVRYIGPLSRFIKIEGPANQNSRILVILSGPEPQRTILEQLILSQADNLLTPMVLIRGLPVNTDPMPKINGVTIFDHLPATELEKQISNSSIVVCRAGYTSIMDMLIMGKKMVLIPTPGQTEQEYLGRLMQEQKSAVLMLQKNFNLNEIESLISTYPFEIQVWENEEYQMVLSELANQLKITNF